MEKGNAELTEQERPEGDADYGVFLELVKIRRWVDDTNRLVDTLTWSVSFIALTSLISMVAVLAIALIFGSRAFW